MRGRKEAEDFFLVYVWRLERSLLFFFTYCVSSFGRGWGHGEERKLLDSIKHECVAMFCYLSQ